MDVPTTEVTSNQMSGSEQLPDTPASDEGSSSTVNWADFADDAEDTASEFDVEGDLEVSETGSPSEVAETQTPPKVDPTPAEAPTPPSTQPTVQPAATPAAEPLSSAPVTPPVQQPQQDYRAWRGQQLDGLSKHYAMNEDDARALLTEPETVLPKLAAQVHLDVMEQVMRSVQVIVPNMVQQVNQRTQVESQADEMFFGANPDLRSVDRNAILQIGAMYRQVNPRASADEAVRVIGNMVRSAMGMQAPVAPAPQQQMSTPAAAPFVPARGGAVAGQRFTTQPNPWEGLIGDDD